MLSENGPKMVEDGFIIAAAIFFGWQKWWVFPSWMISWVISYKYSVTLGYLA